MVVRVVESCSPTRPSLVEADRTLPLVRVALAAVLPAAGERSSTGKQVSQEESVPSQPFAS